VTSIGQTRVGARLTAHLHDGSLTLTVDEVDADNRLPRLVD
jgi:hypothetical protein